MVTMFGNGYFGLLSDAWQLQGNTWSQLQGPLPPKRDGGAMVYDSSRARLVLFGGLTGLQLQDTWEWDGTSWTQINPVVMPPARADHAMAYDPIREVTVMFGGRVAGSSNSVQDTWEWNGITWQQRAFQPALAR